MRTNTTHGRITPRRKARPEPDRYPFAPKPYVPTEREIDGAISVLRSLQRTKTIRPGADTYVDLKRAAEIVSGQYISARAMVLAAMELGFKMRFTKPTGHSASINVSQRAVNGLRKMAGLA